MHGSPFKNRHFVAKDLLKPNNAINKTHIYFILFYIIILFIFYINILHFHFIFYIYILYYYLSLKIFLNI